VRHETRASLAVAIKNHNLRVAVITPEVDGPDIPSRPHNPSARRATALPRLQPLIQAARTVAVATSCHHILHAVRADVACEVLDSFQALPHDIQIPLQVSVAPTEGRDLILALAKPSGPSSSTVESCFVLRELLFAQGRDPVEFGFFSLESGFQFLCPAHELVVLVLRLYNGVGNSPVIVDDVAVGTAQRLARIEGRSCCAHIGRTGAFLRGSPSGCEGREGA